MSQTSGITSAVRVNPPDQLQREAALDAGRSILVQAPAGSGKTDLLTRRFLRLLAEVGDPAQLVAITFTKAAAAEMRDRVLKELEKAATIPPTNDDEHSMEALADRATSHAASLGWNLLESPSLLRISTIDSFCRELAIQRPLLSGLTGELQLSENPAELYRVAARRTLEQIDSVRNPRVSEAVKSLLAWRDNNWKDLEDQLVSMLEKRDRWMQEFVLEGERDWDVLRAVLEEPFSASLAQGLHRLTAMLAGNREACAEVHALARFACTQCGKYRDLAELPDFPCGPFESPESMEEARLAFLCLSSMVLTDKGEFRLQINKNNGFPVERKSEKQRMLNLIQHLQSIPGIQHALARIGDLPPARYTEEEWHIVRACFSILRHAAAELRVAFEESNSVDFVEVAQRAQQILEDEDRLPTEAGFKIADQIQHLLVDEFQDTSRRQYKLIASIVKAWPDTAGRTLFVVGDPMQSIYAFRDADIELFNRVATHGLDVSPEETLAVSPLSLIANFRTAHALVRRNNENFAEIFGADDGSGIKFVPSGPARSSEGNAAGVFRLHLDFMQQSSRAGSDNADLLRAKEESAAARRDALSRQIDRMVSLIRSHQSHIDQARSSGGKFRIAILGRTKSSLASIAAALRDEKIPFRAIDLESLGDRREVLDVLALAAAIMNDEDRVAWLAVLRAPWCGLRLDELHRLVSADDPAVMSRTVPSLLHERLALLEPASRSAVERVERAVSAAHAMRAEEPTRALGTWLRASWEELGGPACVDATAAENLELLWSCMDQLPEAELSLLGDDVHAMLAKLMAQPDPAAESNTGIQLMTIHKSKGLEFEVVIVPELQAGCGRTEKAMLSWLERGISESDPDHAPTEFLIAPQQSRGTERGDAKAWVDRERTKRERQEMRRLLYVASTRAREELHLFARPEFREKDGQRKLCVKSDSLLNTGWAAFGPFVQQAFDEWSASQSETVVQLAAEAAVLEMPRRSRPNRSVLLRLPDDFESTLLNSRALNLPKIPSAAFERHKGGLESRTLGVGVHLLLEHAALWAATLSWPEIEKKITNLNPRVQAQARSVGLPPSHAELIADKALRTAREVLRDPVGQWMLSPHAQAESEATWTEWDDSGPRLLRVDRIFRAGDVPLQTGEDNWWIIDYKTAQIEVKDRNSALTQLRTIYAGQLETYARVLRQLRGNTASIRVGIYYPRLQLFDWWKL